MSVEERSPLLNSDSVNQTKKTELVPLHQTVHEFQELNFKIKDVPHKATITLPSDANTLNESQLKEIEEIISNIDLLPDQYGKSTFSFKIDSFLTPVTVIITNIGADVFDQNKEVEKEAKEASKAFKQAHSSPSHRAIESPRTQFAAEKAKLEATLTGLATKYEKLVHGEAARRLDVNYSGLVEMRKINAQLQDIRQSPLYMQLSQLPSDEQKKIRTEINSLIKKTEGSIQEGLKDLRSNPESHNDKTIKSQLKGGFFSGGLPDFSDKTTREDVQRIIGREIILALAGNDKEAFSNVETMIKNLNDKGQLGTLLTEYVSKQASGKEDNSSEITTSHPLMQEIEKEQRKKEAEVAANVEQGKAPSKETFRDMFTIVSHKVLQLAGKNSPEVNAKYAKITGEITSSEKAGIVRLENLVASYSPKPLDGAKEASPPSMAQPKSIQASEAPSKLPDLSHLQGEKNKKSSENITTGQIRQVVLNFAESPLSTSGAIRKWIDIHKEVEKLTGVAWFFAKIGVALVSRIHYGVLACFNVVTSTVKFIPRLFIAAYLVHKENVSLGDKVIKWFKLAGQSLLDPVADALTGFSLVVAGTPPTGTFYQTNPLTTAMSETILPLTKAMRPEELYVKSLTASKNTKVEEIPLVNLKKRNTKVK